MNARNLDAEGHPAIGELFRTIRSVDRQTDRDRFVDAMRTLGIHVGYEIAGAMSTREEVVTTPLGERTLQVYDRSPVLAVLLRAALPLWEGLRIVFPRSESMIIGAARREGTRTGDGLEMTVDLTYEGLVDSTDRPLILIDPMLATGSTLVGVHQLLSERGHHPSRVFFAGAIAYSGAIERLEREIPGIEIFTGQIDEELNENGYIVPGLGDAGDLAFGTKL